MPLTVAQIQLEVSASGADTVKKGLSGINDEAGKHPSLFQKATAGLAGFFTAGAAVDLLKQGFGAVTDAVGGFISAANDANLINAQTVAGLKSTHDASGMTAQGIQDLAGHISSLSGIDDQAVQTASNMLLTFTGIGKDVFPQATQAAADMATKMNGGAIPSAQQMQQQALLLGKALNDPIKGVTALTREGVTFTDAQKKQIAAMEKSGDVAGAQAIILGEVQKEFGGAAQAAGDTFAGKLAKLNVQWQNMQVVIGNAIIPILSKLLDAVQPIISSLGDALPGVMATLQSVVQPVFDGISDVITQLAPVVQSLFSSLSSGASGSAGPLDTLKSIFAQVQPIVSQVGSIFQTVLVPAFKALAPVVQQLAGFYLAEFSGIMSNVQPVLKLVGTILQNAILPVFQTLANVIATDILPVATKLIDAVQKQLIPAYLKLYTALEPLLELLAHVLQPVLEVIGWILGNIVGPALLLLINIIALVITVIATVIGWFTSLGDTLGALGDAFGNLFGVIGTFVGNVLGALGNLIGGALGKLGELHDKAVAAVDGMVGSILGKIGELVGSALGKIGQLRDNIVSTLMQLPGKMIAIGQSIIDGLLNSLRDNAGRILSWITGLAGNILSSVKNVFGIASPSKEFAKIGQALGDGILAGFDPEGIASQVATGTQKIKTAALGTMGGRGDISGTGLGHHSGSGGSATAAHHAAHAAVAHAHAHAASGAHGGRHHTAGASRPQSATDAQGNYIIYLQLDNRTIGKALLPYITEDMRQMTGSRLVTTSK